MQKTTEALKDELESKGIRPSYHRIKVLEYLHQKQGHHPTADEIYATLSSHIPSLAKATIYNTLHSFVKAGLTRVISIDGVEMRYDMGLHNHGHFICGKCAAITNFNIDLDSFPVDELKQFRIEAKNVFFSGLCPNCLNQSE